METGTEPELVGCLFYPAVRNFGVTGVKTGDECLDGRRAKMRTGALIQFVDGVFDAESRAVSAVGGHGIESIGDGDETGAVARGEVLHDGTRTPSTEADETDLDRITAGDLGT